MNKLQHEILISYSLNSAGHLIIVIGYHVIQKDANCAIIQFHVKINQLNCDIHFLNSNFEKEIGALETGFCTFVKGVTKV